MGSDKDEIKLKSALAILEYVFGKPTQTIKQDSPPMLYESIIRKIEQEKEEKEQAEKQE